MYLRTCLLHFIASPVRGFLLLELLAHWERPDNRIFLSSFFTFLIHCTLKWFTFINYYNYRIQEVFESITIVDLICVYLWRKGFLCGEVHLRLIKTSVEEMVVTVNSSVAAFRTAMYGFIRCWMVLIQQSCRPTRTRGLDGWVVPRWDGC